MRKAITLIAAAALLASAPAALASRPQLSLTAADTAVADAVAAEMAAQNDLNAYLDEVGADGPSVTITSYATYPCDRDTQYRALCDYTFSYSDGTSCDDTLVVTEAKVGTREHLWVRSVTGWEYPDSACYPTGS